MAIKCLLGSVFVSRAVATNNCLIDLSPEKENEKDEELHNTRSLSVDIRRWTKWIRLNYFVFRTRIWPKYRLFDRQIRPTLPNGVTRKFQLRFCGDDEGSAAVQTNMLSAQITRSGPSRLTGEVRRTWAVNGRGYVDEIPVARKTIRVARIAISCDCLPMHSIPPLFLTRC